MFFAQTEKVYPTFEGFGRKSLNFGVIENAGVKSKPVIHNCVSAKSQGGNLATLMLSGDYALSTLASDLPLGSWSLPF